MYQDLSIGEQKIRFDRDATIALYSDTIKVPGADECTCLYCKNFAAQRRKIYPPEFLQLLNQLGADPLKELEAFEYSTENGRSLYGGWFVFCGELIEGVEKRPERSSFYFWFTSSFPNATLPPGAQCAIEFVAEIPWILPEKPEKE